MKRGNDGALKVAEERAGKRTRREGEDDSAATNAAVPAAVAPMIAAVVQRGPSSQHRSPAAEAAAAAVAAAASTGDNQALLAAVSAVSEPATSSVTVQLASTSKAKAVAAAAAAAVQDPRGASVVISQPNATVNVTTSARTPSSAANPGFGMRDSSPSSPGQSQQGPRGKVYRRFAPAAKATLEMQFKATPRPTPAQKHAIATQINEPVHRVSRWFNNQRMRLRRAQVAAAGAKVAVSLGARAEREQQAATAAAAAAAAASNSTAAATAEAAGLKATNIATVTLGTQSARAAAAEANSKVAAALAAASVIADSRPKHPHVQGVDGYVPRVAKRFTSAARARMEEEFQAMVKANGGKLTPDSDRARKVAEELNEEYRRVKVWFANRRAREAAAQNSVVPRPRLSPDNLAHLLVAFEEDEYPSKPELAWHAQQLGVKETRVVDWYRNKRRVNKRKASRSEAATTLVTASHGGQAAGVVPYNFSVKEPYGSYELRNQYQLISVSEDPTSLPSVRQVTVKFRLGGGISCSVVAVADKVQGMGLQFIVGQAAALHINPTNHVESCEKVLFNPEVTTRLLAACAKFAPKKITGPVLCKTLTHMAMEDAFSGRAAPVPLDRNGVTFHLTNLIDNMSHAVKGDKVRRFARFGVETSARARSARKLPPSAVLTDIDDRAVEGSQRVVAASYTIGKQTLTLQIAMTPAGEKYYVSQEVAGTLLHLVASHERGNRNLVQQFLSVAGLNDSSKSYSSFMADEVAMLVTDMVRQLGEAQQHRTCRDGSAFTATRGGFSLDLAAVSAKLRARIMGHDWL